MRVIRCWSALCLVIASLIVSLSVSLPAFAHLQFTYTSQELPLTSYFVNNEPWDIAEFGLAPVAFTLSFTAPEQDLSLKPRTDFLLEDFSFSLVSPNADDILYYPLDLNPSSYGQVTLNQAGDIAGWNLVLRISEAITPETNLLFHRLSRHFVTVKSSGGEGSCNCDQFINRFHPTTWHRHWIQLAKLELTYAEASSPGNWTIEKIAVPEPGVAGLLVAGLLGLLWSRRGSRGARGLPAQ